MNTILRRIISTICVFIVSMMINSSAWAQDSLAQYHPLGKGNIWIYQITRPVGRSYYTRREVKGDSTIDGKAYRIIAETNSVDSISRSSVERYDISTGCYFTRSGNTDVLQDSTFTFTPNANFGGNVNNRVFEKIEQTTVFGAQKATRQINDSHLPKENVITWSYAYGLGLVHVVDLQLVNYIPSWVQTLVYAKIDGKEYGTAPMSDSLVDVFPLEIGKQWTYAYKYVYQEYMRFADSGTVTLQVLDRANNIDSTVWKIREIRNLCFQSDYYPYSTPSISIDTFNLVEAQYGRHKLYLYPSSKDSRFPMLPFRSNLPDSCSVYRYAVIDSANVKSVTVRNVWPNIYYLSFKKEIGLVSLRGTDGCTCTKSYSISATLQESSPPISTLPMYYPLGIGTRWYFTGQPLADYTPASPQEVFGDTTMANGKKYSTILYDQGQGLRYERATNDSVFVYTPSKNSEALLYRFNAKEKDTVARFMGAFDTTDVILLDTTVMKYFGRPLRTFTFLIDTRHTIDEERWITIADSIGVTKTSAGPSYLSSIQGAVIDGIQYGRIQPFTQMYYPLSVGNQWFYDSSSTPYTIKVGSDTVIANGEHYRILNRPDFAGGKYVRTDSHYVSYFDKANNREISVFKLDGKKGDTTYFKSGLFGNDHSVIMGIDTVMMFGERTRVIRYRLEGFGQRDVSLSDKFGPVRASLYADPPAPWPDFTYTSVGCVIDGWRYGLVTSVKNEQFSPVEFSLAQNYPNPFNPSTTLSFTIPLRSHVTLKIFDVIGREVATIIFDELPAGKYLRQWNASGFPSGVYFYRLQAGSYTDTKRLILLK